MVAYLQNNLEVVSLVRNGQASLVGVTPVQQKAIIEVVGVKEGTEVQPKTIWW
ncbi:competence pheromone ComX [Paenibacillus albiflavus]|uniref:ComX pheromone n=2 Tax=Paenibacillus albiflavus TaxID=2545760 RepID=A0A4R4E9A3_9BACL|nr:competence pheromone ComX [Paenibacillus albiflavus]